MIRFRFLANCCVICSFGERPLVRTEVAYLLISDAFSNQLLGAATLDRLRHGAYRVVPDGKSYRSNVRLELGMES